jgi:hypothetical protein
MAWPTFAIASGLTETDMAYEGQDEASIKRIQANTS